MKIALVILSCALWGVRCYPYYPYYGNMDSVSLGSSDSSRGGMVMSRFYNPYGMAGFMIQQPDQQVQPARQYQPVQYPPSQYYLPERRRQTPPDVNLAPPQENEVFPTYQTPERPITEPSEIADATDRTEVSTTPKTIYPELIEPEIEEIEPVKPKKRVPKKKQVKKPVDDEEDDEYFPRMPGGSFFPMIFGWGRSSGSAPGGATAIANAYSTGKGGVASSHATAYGAPRPDFKTHQQA